MNIPKYAIVRAEEWTGLYMDGQLVDEAHSFSAKEVCRAFSLPVVFYMANEEILEDGDGFPLNLNEAVKR